MSNRLVYPARLIPDDNGTLRVEFPDFPEAHTFGDNEADALLHARDALATIIDTYIRDRRLLPRPSLPTEDMHLVDAKEASGK